MEIETIAPEKERSLSFGGDGDWNELDWKFKFNQNTLITSWFLALPEGVNLDKDWLTFWRSIQQLLLLATNPLVSIC